LNRIIRGEDGSEGNPRTQIKSMLRAKSFRPAINDFEAGVRWLRIFAADIFLRCVEEGVLENKRKPKTINLHYRQGAQARSKQPPVPQGQMLPEQILINIAKHLVAQINMDGRAWPCSNLSLSLADSRMGSRIIAGLEVSSSVERKRKLCWRVRGKLQTNKRTRSPPEKRRRLDNGPRIQSFFAPRAQNADTPSIRSPERQGSGEQFEEDAEWTTTSPTSLTSLALHLPAITRYHILSPTPKSPPSICATTVPLSTSPTTAPPNKHRPISGHK
jgi:DNA polymerase eta